MRPPRGAALGPGANPRGQEWGLPGPCRGETHPKSQQGLSGRVFCLVKRVSLEAFSTRCSGLGIIESLLCSERTFLKLFPCSIGNLPSAPVPCHPSLGGCHPCWGRRLLLSPSVSLLPGSRGCRGHGPAPAPHGESGDPRQGGPCHHWGPGGSSMCAL